MSSSFSRSTARPEVLFPAYRAGFRPVGNRPAPVSGIPYFLERRARLLESMESTPEMVRTLAVTYAEQAIDKAEAKQLDEALAVARRAATLRPNESLVLYALGSVHEARHEQAPAEEAFRKLIRLDPTSPYAQQAARRLKRSSSR